MADATPTRPVCFHAEPAAEPLFNACGCTHVVRDEFRAGPAIALCFSEADAKRVAEALNNAAGRATLREWQAAVRE
jgi:hypothetical protein